jgi:hypothetical protein
MPKAAKCLTQVVAGSSPRSPGFLISVIKVSEKSPDSVFKLDVGNLRSAQIAGKNLRNSTLLKGNDYTLPISVQIL